MKKLSKHLIAIIASTVISLLCVPLLAGCLDPGYTILLLSMCSRPDPPVPEITSAEFPFKIVYTVDGEEFVYEDVITCEYTGINNDASQRDKYRTWQHSYGKKPYTVLRELDNEQVILFYIPCSASYLMGDPEASNYYGGSPEITLASPYQIYSSGEMTYRSDRVIEAQELKDIYGIEIISFEMPPPIENTFSSEDTVNDSEE